LNDDGKGGSIEGVEFNWDILAGAPDSFHIIYKSKSYSIIVDERIKESNEYVIRVNRKKIRVKVKDKMDLLMEEMGIDLSASKKVNEVKAPMPGLVLRTIVASGDEVKKGDTLLVLEAMKMENSIKSPGDGVVSVIHVKEGQAVEKNQSLISFR
jgi:biotin carboxyl carrier protein